MARTLVCPEPEAVVDKHEAYLEMRLKIEAVFEHYTAQSEYFQRAHIAQRFAMEDAFYRLTMLRDGSNNFLLTVFIAHAPNVS
jgi:hypothetical protein